MKTSDFLFGAFMLFIIYMIIRLKKRERYYDNALAIDIKQKGVITNGILNQNEHANAFLKIICDITELKWILDYSYFESYKNIEKQVYRCIRINSEYSNGCYVICNISFDASNIMHSQFTLVLFDERNNETLKEMHTKDIDHLELLIWDYGRNERRNDSEIIKYSNSIKNMNETQIAELMLKEYNIFRTDFSKRHKL